MPRTANQLSADTIVALEKRLEALEQQNALANASLYDANIPVFGRDGLIKTSFGKQADGSYGGLVRNSGPQPQLTAPILTAGELGSALAEWDGNTASGESVPEVHGHVEVLAAFWAEGQPEPTFVDAKLYSTIRDRAGGATTLALGKSGVWVVWLRLVGQDRVTKAEPSDSAQVQIESRVDTADIEQKLEEARQEREQYIKDFNERTAEYDRKQVERADALAAADAWSSNAFYRADQAAAEASSARVEASEAAGAAQDAQSRYDAVSSRQDASEEEIASARAEAAAAHAEAGEAKQYAATIADQVNGIGKTIRSTEPPSGTANDGDYWRQFDSMDRNRRLKGWWEFRDGAWDQLSLDVTVLPMAEIGQLVVDDIRAQRLFAETGEIERLAIGDFENHMPQASIDEFAARGTESPEWNRIRGTSGRWTTVSGQGRGMEAIRINDGAAGAPRTTVEFRRGGRGVRLRNGDTFRLKFYGWAGGAGAAPQINFLIRDASGAFLGRPDTATVQSGWREYELAAHSTSDEERYLLVEFDVPSGAAMRGHWQDFNFVKGMTGELIVDGITRSTEGVINRLFTDTTVATSVWSQVVRTRLLEAEEALIGEVLLKNGAVTAAKLHVTEAMSAAIGEFLYLSADHIDVNSLVFQSGLVGMLEAYGITLSNEAGRRRFAVSGDGFRLTDTETDQVLAQLGTQSDDLISLHDSETGDPVITMTQDGGIASQALSVASDPSFGGKRLAGDLYESPRWHSSSSVFEMTGGHALGHHRRSFSGDTSGNSGNGQSIAHLEAVLEPGRMYAVRCHDFQMADRQGYYLEAFYTTSDDKDVRPEPPNRFSLTWGAVPGRVPAAGGDHGTTLSFDRVMAFNTAQRIRINFVVGLYSASGTLRFGMRQRHAPHFTIIDLGPNLGSSGSNLWQASGSSTASVPAPQSLLREIYPVARTATYTLSSSGVATRQYTNGEMRFGRWPDGNTYLTVVEFAPWNQVGVPQGVDLPFRVSRWAGTRGSIVQVGVPGFSGTPASFSYGSDVEVLPAVRNVSAAGGAVRVPLEREQQMGLADRQSAAMVLGGAGWTTAPYPASGVATTAGVTAALSTDVSGQTTGEGSE